MLSDIMKYCIENLIAVFHRSNADLVLNAPGMNVVSTVHERNTPNKKHLQANVMSLPVVKVSSCTKDSASELFHRVLHV